MANKKINTIVSPTGIAWYPNIRKPDYYEGVNQGYKVSLELSPEELEAFRRQCAEAIEAAKVDPRFNGKPFDNPALPIVTMSNGKTVIKYKSAATIKTRDRGEIERKIPVYDCDGQIIPETVDIGSGSKIKVAYFLSAYNMGRRANGIAARIVAVQVVDLVAPGAHTEPKASSFGFGKVAGGTCHADTAEAQQAEQIAQGAQGFDLMGNPVEDF